MNARADGLAFESRAIRDRSRAPAAAARAGDSFLCALLGIYLASLVFEGVLRYALAASGLPNAIYLRDAIPVATLLVLFLRPLLGEGRMDLAIAVPAALLAFHAAYSALVGVAFFAIAFGLKIFMFIPYGMAMWPLLRQRFDAALTLACVMFAATAVGVFANFLFGRLPWEGLEYETAFGTVSTTRLWWMGDLVPRLPGFARTSFNAAMILGITGLLALIKFRHPMARVAIAAVAISAIVLTTSKGMMLVFPLAALWLLVQDDRPWMKGNGLVMTLCAATLALPLAIVLLDLGSAMRASSFPDVLLSVWDRFSDMWPLAFGLLPEGPHALLGAGLGSIGTPQMFGDASHRANAADNFAIYMMVSFGLPGLCYYVAPALSVRGIAASQPAPVHRAYVALLFVAYGYGMSINMVEESFFAICIGLCCGAAAQAWLRPEVQR
ncbi:MAG: hypothetical protein Q8R01_05310 [Ramlibacter sp.]|nr:hypothetical protein [Ramlibacter sp.]